MVHRLLFFLFSNANLYKHLLCITLSDIAFISAHELFIFEQVLRVLLRFSRSTVKTPHDLETFHVEKNQARRRE